MILGLDVITVLVRDLDDTVRFHTESLGFEKRAGVSMTDGYPWAAVGGAFNE
jgi:catechol 2,3-dioxygenase-like lactoylglutathione lyase family enzyme